MHHLVTEGLLTWYICSVRWDNEDRATHVALSRALTLAKTQQSPEIKLNRVLKLSQHEKNAGEVMISTTEGSR